MPPLLDDPEQVGLTTIDSPTAAVSRKSFKKTNMTSPMSRLRTLSGESSFSLPPSLPSSPSSSSTYVSPPPPPVSRASSSTELSNDPLKENDPPGRRRCASMAAALELQKRASASDTLELRLRHSIEHKGESHPDTSMLFNKMGNLHFRKGNFPMAELYYEKAALCESEQHVAFLNLGTVHWRTHQLEKAISYLKRAKRGTKDAGAKASVYHQLGLCYALAEDYMNSLHALTKAYNIRMRCNGESHASVAKTLDAIGRVHLMQGEYDAAIHYHGKALTIIQAGQQKPEILATLSNLVAVFKACGRTSDELEALNEMHRLAPSERLLDQIRTLRGDV